MYLNPLGNITLTSIIQGKGYERLKQWSPKGKVLWSRFAQVFQNNNFLFQIQGYQNVINRDLRKAGKKLFSWCTLNIQFDKNEKKKIHRVLVALKKYWLFIIFSRLPGLENSWTNFKDFLRIQDWTNPVWSFIKIILSTNSLRKCMEINESGEVLSGYWGLKSYAFIFCLIGQFWIYQNSFLTLGLRGIKWKKWTTHPWISVWFFLFIPLQPMSQVWIVL